MPLQYTSYHDDPLCLGSTITVLDEDRLVEIVAVLLLGLYSHAEELLRDLPEIRAPRRPAAAAQAIAANLMEPEVEGTDPWHRDGWLFQMISWIAARSTLDPRALLRAPQSRPADKGLDGLIIDVATDGSPITLRICEDKATQNPRRTVRDLVFKEFIQFESGSRDHELISEATTMLSGRYSPAELPSVLESLLWQNPRSYRIAVTTPSSVSDSTARGALFADYADTVEGPCSRRGADVVHVDDLRAWMRQFASKVAASLTKAE